MEEDNGEVKMGEKKDERVEGDEKGQRATVNMRANSTNGRDRICSYRYTDGNLTKQESQRERERKKEVEG